MRHHGPGAIYQPRTRRDFKGNVWRHLLADAIEKNGGYCRNLQGNYALEWTLGVYESVPDSEDLYKLGMSSEYMPTSHEDFDAVVTKERLQDLLDDEWSTDSYKQRLWDWVVEDMREGVTGSDTYRCVRPEIAEHYGLPYYRFPKQFRRRTEEDRAYHPAKFTIGNADTIEPDWVMVDPFTVEMFDVEWEFAGRGGKHLCLTEFEGRSLRDRSDDLAERIRHDDDGSYPNEWCQKLLAFIHECDLCFTSKAVKDEFTYQCGFRAAEELEELYHECLAEAKEAAERLYWAERDTMTIY